MWPLAGRIPRRFGAGLTMRRTLAVAGGALGRAVAGALDGATVVDAGEVATRDEAHAVVDRLGGLDVVVHAVVPEEAVDVRAVADVDDGRWAAVWERSMQSLLWVLQAAHAPLAASGGTVVVVVPTVGMSGAPGLVPLAAVAEGVRVLAKSAARQWGPDGITVNCVAVSPVMAGVAADALGSMALSAPALGAVDIAPVLSFLTGEAARSLTGATLSVDGGVWMAP
jgi:3-oxoacyl-[acyl-carrier protein] reductase